jgi:acyl carrier protein
MSERTETLTDIWRQVLGNPNLDEDSDYFDSGGTSLHVLQIIGEIHRTFGVEVKLREIFFHASPRSVSELLESRLAQEARTANNNS